MPSMNIVSVPALCEFSYEGRSYVRGELVDVPPAVALALARARKVSLKKHAYVTSEAKYRRRDMRAEE